MSLGSNLFKARRKKGLSQEEVAERLGVSRQTISKWETGETLPDIQQAKRLAMLYGLSLDELIELDPDAQEIQAMIDKTSDEVTARIDWTRAWSKKYPILTAYQGEVDIEPYAHGLTVLLERLQREYGYNDLNAMLVLKDILAKVWKARKSSSC